MYSRVFPVRPDEVPLALHESHTAGCTSLRREYQSSCQIAAVLRLSRVVIGLPANRTQRIPYVTRQRTPMHRLRINVCHKLSSWQRCRRSSHTDDTHPSHSSRPLNTHRHSPLQSGDPRRWADGLFDCSRGKRVYQVEVLQTSSQQKTHKPPPTPRCGGCTVPSHMVEGRLTGSTERLVRPREIQVSQKFQRHQITQTDGAPGTFETWRRTSSRT